MAPKHHIDYEKVLQHIGPFGQFQLRVYLKLILCSVAAGAGVVAFVFTGFTPSYRCRVPECESANATYFHYQAPDTPALPVWYNGSLPRRQRCMRPQVEVGEDGTCVANSTHWPEDLSECPMEDLVVDRSLVTSSLVESFQFVCDRAWQKAIYSSLYMVGMLFGSYFFGWLSDTYGRVRSLQLSIVFVSLGGFLSGLCTGVGSVHIFGLLRVITGMGGMGIFLVAYVLLMEHVGFKFRIPAGVAIGIFFTVGETILGVLAYLIRDWQTLQMVAYLPMIAILVPVWFVPESPRWLISTGNLDQAVQVIRQAARTNNKEVPEHLLMEMPTSPGYEVKTSSRLTVLDMFRNRKIATRSLLMCCQWFATSMCYYGLSFTATSLSSGGPYVNFLLSVSIEVPCVFFNLLVIDTWGRRPILSFCQVVSGIACILCGLLQGNGDPVLGYLQMVLFLLGKFGAASAFGVVYVYTSELFPTVIRNQAVGFCSVAARVGSIIAILLSMLKRYWLPAPVVIMGVVATGAGFLAFFLPETVGSTLPETIEEALSIGERNNRGFCTCVWVSPVRMFRENPISAEVSLAAKAPRQVTEHRQPRQGYENTGSTCYD